MPDAGVRDRGKACLGEKDSVYRDDGCCNERWSAGGAWSSSRSDRPRCSSRASCACGTCGSRGSDGTILHTMSVMSFVVMPSVLRMLDSARITDLDVCHVLVQVRSSKSVKQKRGLVSKGV